ncbi:hypothetical protein ABZ135_26500 [Streptomyces sp. NPDC006339]|uniref:hypothetical protein n=1 Tax=Streptomyces sp. NPDC006339 TaxID=3156755 RepID=UPI0033A46BE0
MARRALAEAEGLLERELRADRHMLADLTTEEAWLAFLRFGRRLFDVSNTPDADGLLFQYGTYSFDGPRLFTLDLVRQFAISDSDGEHDHYVQVHCELRYAPAPALEVLGSFDSWFFHDAGEDLEGWSRSLTERAAWNAIKTLEPAEIRVYQERV